MPLSVVEKREPRMGFSRRIPCVGTHVSLCVGRIRYFKSVLVGYGSFRFGVSVRRITGCVTQRRQSDRDKLQKYVCPSHGHGRAVVRFERTRAVGQRENKRVGVITIVGFLFVRCRKPDHSEE